MKKLFFTFLLLIGTFNMEAQIVRPGDGHHFIAGGLLSGGAYQFVSNKNGTETSKFIWSLAVPLLASVAKELYDEYGSVYGSGFDMRDIATTMSGAIIVTFTFKILQNKNKNKKRIKQ
jgi:hypothetical protein